MYKTKKQAIIESAFYVSMLILAFLFQYNVFHINKDAATITASLLFLVGTIMLIASLNGLIKLTKATVNPAYKDISYDYKKGTIIYDLHKLGVEDDIDLDLTETSIIIVIKNEAKLTRLIVSNDSTVIEKEEEGKEKEVVNLDSSLGQEEIYKKLLNIHNDIVEETTEIEE